MEATCSGSVWMGRIGFLRCNAKAKVERDGKAYCLTHDPVRVANRNAERAAKQTAKWNERQQARKAADELRDEMKRRYDCHDALVEALKHARNEIASAPRSLGYAITALPKIDAALALAGETP